MKIVCITDVLAGFFTDNTAAEDYKERPAGSRLPAGRSESMLHFFGSVLFLFSSSLFSRSRTTVTAT
jgi:hypothetical protein